MLTLNGYRLLKTGLNSDELKKTLTVKPVIPSVFVKPRNVPKYPVYHETTDALYLPKHFGIEKYGIPKETTRDVPQTDSKFWEFAGSIRPAQEAVVNSMLQPDIFKVNHPKNGIKSLHTGGGKTVSA